MKKFFSLALVFCLIIPCVFMLSACGHEHTFAEAWTFNDTHHWHASTCEHSNEKADYAEHVDENEDEICDVCRHGVVALIGDVEYTSLEAAINEAESGDTIVIFDDIELTSGVSINKDLIIDLNGKTITAPNSASTALFRVETDGKLTINGEGIVNSASQANDYSMAVWARNGGEVIINGGTFTNVGAKDFEDNGTTPNNNELIYASNTLTDETTYSVIKINGGTFIGNNENETWGTRYALNMKDNTQCVIDVRGGEFHQFNPSEGLSEYPQANFVADGYEVVENNGVYTVVAE